MMHFPGFSHPDVHDEPQIFEIAIILSKFGTSFCLALQLKPVMNFWINEIKYLHKHGCFPQIHEIKYVQNSSTTQCHYM